VINNPGGAPAAQFSPRLGEVGIGPLHERIYRYLIGEGGSRSVREIGEALGVSVQAGRSALRALEDNGLVTRTPTTPRGYLASPPELALDTLVGRRTDELAQVRRFAKELQEEFRLAAGEGSAADLVEVIVGRQWVVRYYLHLVQTAKHDFAALTKPPYVAGDDDTPHSLRAQDLAIRRGVHWRAIYDSDALTEEVTHSVLRQSLAMGEDARALAGVPIKLAVVDRRIGFVPLKPDTPGSGALVVHASSLLDALMALFDSMWARAVPLRADAEPAEPTELDERARQVLTLLSAGLKDESIARVMRTSRRTVQKHVTAVMDALGARTRFQAALLAAERGWVRVGDRPANHS
jgi:DNA-binding CsgD family transcriptional regulator/DNA-binding Lrp family transcriptional regulator